MKYSSTFFVNLLEMSSNPFQKSLIGAPVMTSPDRQSTRSFSRWPKCLLKKFGCQRLSSSCLWTLLTKIGWGGGGEKNQESLLNCICISLWRFKCGYFFFLLLLTSPQIVSFLFLSSEDIHNQTFECHKIYMEIMLYWRWYIVELLISFSIYQELLLFLLTDHLQSRGKVKDVFSFH